MVCKSGMRRNFKKGVLEIGGRLQRSVGSFPEGTCSPVKSGVTEDLDQSGVLSVVTVMGQGARVRAVVKTHWKPRVQLKETRGVLNGKTSMFMDWED